MTLITCDDKGGILQYKHKTVSITDHSKPMVTKNLAK